MRPAYTSKSIDQMSVLPRKRLEFSITSICTQTHTFEAKLAPLGYKLQLVLNGVANSSRREKLWNLHLK